MLEALSLCSGCGGSVAPFVCSWELLASHTIPYPAMPCHIHTGPCHPIPTQLMPSACHACVLRREPLCVWALVLPMRRWAQEASTLFGLVAHPAPHACSAITAPDCEVPVRLFPVPRVASAVWFGQQHCHSAPRAAQPLRFSCAPVPTARVLSLAALSLSLVDIRVLHFAIHFCVTLCPRGHRAAGLLLTSVRSWL